MSVSGGCAQADEANDKLASDIEKLVTEKHPDIQLERFARFYARAENGSVKAIYLFANEGNEPAIGKAGTSSWTSLDRLPVVYDGGCSVLNVNYDANDKKLLSVECNGDA